GGRRPYPEPAVLEVADGRVPHGITPRPGWSSPDDQAMSLGDVEAPGDERDPRLDPGPRPHPEARRVRAAVLSQYDRTFQQIPAVPRSHRPTISGAPRAGSGLHAYEVPYEVPCDVLVGRSAPCASS